MSENLRKTRGRAAVSRRDCSMTWARERSVSTHGSQPPVCVALPRPQTGPRRRNSSPLRRRRWRAVPATSAPFSPVLDSRGSPVRREGPRNVGGWVSSAPRAAGPRAPPGPLSRGGGATWAGQTGAGTPIMAARGGLRRGGGLPALPPPSNPGRDGGETEGDGPSGASVPETRIPVRLVGLAPPPESGISEVEHSQNLGSRRWGSSPGAGWSSGVPPEK